MEEKEMSGKEEKKREKEQIEEKKEHDVKKHGEPEEQSGAQSQEQVQGQFAVQEQEQIQNQPVARNFVQGQMPGQPEMPNGMGRMPGMQNRMPAGQQGMQGGYGYQNPYGNNRNNYSNNYSYNHGYDNRNGNGYNNYPNQNYYYGPQGNNGQRGNGGDEPKKSGGKKKALIAVAVILFLAICGGSIYGISYALNSSAKEQKAQEAAAKPAEPQISEVDLEGESADAAGGGGTKPIQANLTDVSDLVERLMPSVVSVNAVYSYKSYWGDDKYDGGGSGFIIGENETELLIATNAHVVADTEDLEVTFADEETADAAIKGRDDDLDVAVIAVKLEDIDAETKKNIAVARLGDSTTLRAGQAVISIGNALLLGQSVTTGIISAVNMPIGGGYDEMGNQYGSDDRVMIQTTAFMNPGCSGGILVNVSGEVIGINTMTINSSDVEGMCYAIPITDAIPVLDKLKTRDIRERLREEDSGYLGVSCTNVEGRQAEDYDIPKGVYVKEVYEDSPAERAGLQRGDVIVALNEETVKTMDELSEMLRYYPVGETVELEVMRYESGEYRSRIISVKLGRR